MRFVGAGKTAVMEAAWAEREAERQAVLVEAQERVVLASYAQKSGDTEGRIHPEPRHPHRTDYQRDRARVIHSRASNLRVR